MGCEEFYNEGVLEEIERPSDDGLVNRLRRVFHFVNTGKQSSLTGNFILYMQQIGRYIGLAIMLTEGKLRPTKSPPAL